MRFWSIDPGSKVTGWAVFDDEDLVGYGTIDSTQVEYSYRYQNIVDGLAKLVKRFGMPDEMAVEEAARFKSASGKPTRIPELEVACMAIRKWAELRCRHTTYHVATWKATVVGKSNATKEEVKGNVMMRFPSLAVDLGEHVYDSIGIGVHHGSVKRLEGLTE